MTKPVTAIAVMQLVETGKLGLYDQIKDYIPAFAGQKVCREKVGDLIYTPDPTVRQDRVSMKKSSEIYNM